MPPLARPTDRPRWKTRVGIVTFLAFLLKGIAWLVVTAFALS